MTLSTHKRIREQARKRQELLEEQKALEEQENAEESESLKDDMNLESMTVPKLKDLAEANEIDLDGATKKADIIEKIITAKTQADVDEALNEDVEDAEQSEGDTDGVDTGTA